MHVRYCECEACLPGVPAQPTRVRTDKQWRKHVQNRRYYQRRKLREAGLCAG